MIQSSFSEKRSIFFRLLSDDQIWEIQQAAFDVLEKTGCSVLHKGAIELFKKAGASVKDDRVKIPRHIVEECIRLCREDFLRVDARLMEKAQRIGGAPRFRPGAAVHDAHDRFAFERKQEAIAMGQDDIGLFHPHGKGKKVAQVTHEQSSSGPAFRKSFTP